MAQTVLRSSSAEFLRALLDGSELAGQELAERIGVAPDTFSSWLTGTTEMTSGERITARRVVREATKARLEDVTTATLFAQVRRRLDEGDVIWAWKALVQTCDWLARGVLPVDNFRASCPGILAVEWETLAAELVGRAVEARGCTRPSWTSCEPLATRWEPLRGARRRGWDADLLALNIALDVHDLEIR